MPTKAQTYAKVYAIAFAKVYPKFSVKTYKGEIEKLMLHALKNVDVIKIDGAAFRMTHECLGIPHTHDAIKEYLK